MKPKRSPLQILDFALTGLEFKMIPPENEEVDIVRCFSGYELDIDFRFSIDDFLKVYMNAAVNRDEKLPGYSMMVEVACIFKFDDGGLEKDVQRQMEGFPTLYITLNTLRGLISNFTANAPFGRYILPSIDLNDLIEKKKKVNNANNKKTQSVKPGSKRNTGKTKK